MSSTVLDDFYGDPQQAGDRSIPYYVGLDGKEESFVPPFRPRSVTLVNLTQGANLIVTDDRGETYTAPPLTSITYGLGPTMRLRGKIDAPQTTGKVSIIVSESKAGITSSQLSTISLSGSSVIQYLAPANFPPANPRDGDLVCLAVDPTNGINWLFRFNAGSSDSRKWEFVGGPPLRASAAAAVSTASAPFVDLGGPGVIVPRTGQYDLDFGALITPAASQFGIISPSGSGFGNAADVNGITQLAGQTYNRRVIGFTATTQDTVTLFYRSTSGSASFERRELRLFPVRIA